MMRDACKAHLVAWGNVCLGGLYLRCTVGWLARTCPADRRDETAGVVEQGLHDAVLMARCKPPRRALSNL